MNMRTAGLVAATLLFGSPLSAGPNQFPPKEFVPDAATAIAVARAVLIPVFGAEATKAEEPLTAERHGDIWVVQGTLPCPKGESCVGGVAELQLSAKDGRILYVTHYQ
jgi:hypothetical protein